MNMCHRYLYYNIFQRESHPIFKACLSFPEIDVYIEEVYFREL